MSAMVKTTLREIRQSLGRYLAIMAIVALGVGLFSGLKATKPFMVESVQQYFTEKQLYDFQLLSTYGFEEQDVEYLAKQDGARKVAGSYTYDILYQYGEVDGLQVMKVHSLTEGINGLEVLAGRLPERADECVVDAQLYGEESIGQVLHISEENTEDTLEVLDTRELTICGVVNSPCYIQFERGNTSIGNGKISGFAYVLPETFSSEIYTEIYVKLDEDLYIYSDAYEDYIAEQKNIWEKYLDEVTEQRFIRIREEAEAELADGKREFEEKKADAEAEFLEAEHNLSEAKSGLDEARKGLDAGKKQIADGMREIRTGYEEIKNNEAALQAGRQELAENRAQLEKQEQLLLQGTAQWQEQQEALNKEKEQLQISEQELNLSEMDLLEREQSLILYEQSIQDGLMNGLFTEEEAASMKKDVEDGKADIALGKKQIQQNREAIQKGYAKIKAGQEELDKSKVELDAGLEQIRLGMAQIALAEQEMETGAAQIETGRAGLEKAEAELNQAKKELQDGEAEYEKGVSSYEEGRQEYEDGLREYQSEIRDAEAELADAENKLKELESPEWYILGRDTNVGYVCLENDSNIVADVSTVFPVFFFLIAALVCMTTMNRMVEEQRTQIGVLKALGYNDPVIMGKYLFYSGSAAFAGCAIGFFAGTYFLSRIIWDAYGIMYALSEMIYFMDWKLALFCLACSMISSVGVTWISCRTELANVAAALMRPKAPKAGKRVFLERVPFIWNRLGFLVKVSIRNVLRYKKRFFMMVIGISGCTGLLVTGFGILDSIAEVTNMQYEEIVLYDMSVTLREKEADTAWGKISNIADGRIENAGLFSEGTLDISYSGTTKSISYVIPQDSASVGEYIDLHTTSGEKIAFSEKGGAVITHKVAEDMGIQIGDRIQLMDDEHHVFELQVENICQNFIFNYIYFSADSCVENWKDPVYQTTYINVLEKEEDIHALAADLMNQDGIVNVTINQDVKERFNNMMGSLDFIVLVIIVCAAALAFIVLYNLTNINITERVREIATIKVLGFHKNETADYVFRENIALTAIGGVAGLLLGKIFHLFVMNCINIDAVAFDVRIDFISYVYSILLTFVFAWFVNRVMSRKLDKISMTESLKSVD